MFFNEYSGVNFSIRIVYSVRQVFFGRIFQELNLIQGKIYKLYRINIQGRWVLNYSN